MATGIIVGLLPESSVVTPGGKDTDKDGTTTVAKSHHQERYPQGDPNDTKRIP